MARANGGPAAPELSPVCGLKRKAPARLPGGRNSNCGFSPSTAGGGRQKNGCQDSCLKAAARGTTVLLAWMTTQVCFRARSHNQNISFSTCAKQRCIPPPPSERNRDACRPPRHDRTSSGEEPPHHRAATGADRAETRGRPSDDALGERACDVRTNPCGLRTQSAVDREGAGDERVALLKARRGPGTSPAPTALCVSA